MGREVGMEFRDGMTPENASQKCPKSTPSSKILLLCGKFITVPLHPILHHQTIPGEGAGVIFDLCHPTVVWDCHSVPPHDFHFFAL